MESTKSKYIQSQIIKQKTIMRNEIYEKISQSRKRYLSELNKKEYQKETPKEKASKAVVKENFSIDPESIIVKLGEWVKSENLKWEIKNRFMIAFRKIPLEGIKGKLNKLSVGIQRKFKRVNQKFTSHSDKFTENFVSYSNRIFEDRYERVDLENQNTNGLVMQTPISNQIVWEFADPVTHQDFLPTFAESLLGELIEKAKNHVINVWRSFVFSLAFDGAMLECRNDFAVKPSNDAEKTIRNGISQNQTRKEPFCFELSNQQIIVNNMKFGNRIINNVLRIQKYIKQLFIRQACSQRFNDKKTKDCPDINRFIWNPYK
jgi:hypothetical protein